eukprot:604497-Amphidinium_carterae.1
MQQRSTFKVWEVAHVRINMLSPSADESWEIIEVNCNLHHTAPHLVTWASQSWHASGHYQQQIA